MQIIRYTKLKIVLLLLLISGMPPCFITSNSLYLCVQLKISKCIKSPVFFGRCCKATLGISVVGYRTNLRIEIKLIFLGTIFFSGKKKRETNRR